MLVVRSRDGAASSGLDSADWLNSNLEAPGGLLKSKPMVRNTWECFAPSVFFCALRDLFEIVQSAPVGSDSLSRIVRFDKARARRREREGMAMNKNDSTIAQQLADAASRFQSQRTGHSPTAVTAVLLEDMIVVTLDDALTPAEQSLSKSSDGAARVQEFHRQLFANSSDEMRQEIQRITGRQVRKRLRK